MRQMRSLVHAAIQAPDYGRTLAVGQVVDLDERLPQGGTLADLVKVEWFEPVGPEARPRRRPAPAADMTDAPARPGAKEDVDG